MLKLNNREAMTSICVAMCSSNLMLGSSIITQSKTRAHRYIVLWLGGSNQFL